MKYIVRRQCGACAARLGRVWSATVSFALLLAEEDVLG